MARHCFHTENIRSSFNTKNRRLIQRCCFCGVTRSSFWVWGQFSPSVEHGYKLGWGYLEEDFVYESIVDPDNCLRTVVEHKHGNS